LLDLFSDVVLEGNKPAENLSIKLFGKLKC
jgi:hypothetical protein